MNSSLKGDRKTYQQDPANGREGVREALLDVAEGADIVMVKPALSYLDVLSAVRAAVDVPVAAYNISGEYSMVEAAAANGWIDREAAIVEVLTSIRRAGADIILSYWSLDAAVCSAAGAPEAEHRSSRRERLGLSGRAGEKAARTSSGQGVLVQESALTQTCRIRPSQSTSSPWRKVCTVVIEVVVRCSSRTSMSISWSKRAEAK